ncbi:MAG: hypothetical protein QNJ98_01585 [Planctomycetota bacterium]|nr:hypothetical protein [Planctomycetota bacterium]
MAARKKRARKKPARKASSAPRLWVPTMGIFLLRVFTGLLFIDAVYFKLWVTRMRAPDPAAADGGGLGLGLFDALEHFVEHDYKVLVRQAVENPPQVFGTTWTWFSDFLEAVMLPGAVPDVMGPAILFFELLLGIALVLGVGVRLMAMLGAALMLIFGLAKGMYFLTIAGTNWLLFFVLVALALTAAGRMWGLDSRLQNRLPGWVS